ncbi:acyl-CoA thioesterase II [Salisaeta longa]|uniref:acyl-CoA thioesterase II n=1 Tax=Salisaeta longa TaxID=503170 RepID=UPI0003B4ECD2|nr:acyl-CoA thioesterase II [Salisaeta longa]
MGFSLEDLLALLDLERIEHNIFRGQSVDIGSGSVYGGQALAQSLVAARYTVGDDTRRAHSMHGYFILAGDVAAPIVYDVDRLRDGNSFATRRIVAIQHGRAIFNMAASFQSPEDGASHQTEMPDVPGPEGLTAELDLLRAIADRIPPKVRHFYTRERPIEVRPVDPVNPFDPAPTTPVSYRWLRTHGPMPDDPLLHQAVLAYASDYGLLGTALRPHGLSFVQPNLQLASLDHAIWFHRPFRTDEWLLYAMDSPAADQARGFTRGQIFAQDGTLVASVAQEGLMRVWEDT